MTFTINRQITTNNLNRSSQSMKGTLMKRARKYTMSLAFAATILTGLLTSTGTAQAQRSSNCGYEKINSVTVAYCPINNDSGYYYSQVNGSWQRTHYYKGASTKMLYTQNLTSGGWAALDKTTGTWYMQTSSGWVKYNNNQGGNSQNPAQRPL